MFARGVFDRLIQSGSSGGLPGQHEFTFQVPISTAPQAQAGSSRFPSNMRPPPGPRPAHSLPAAFKPTASAAIAMSVITGKAPSAQASGPSTLAAQQVVSDSGATRPSIPAPAPETVPDMTTTGEPSTSGQAPAADPSPLTESRRLTIPTGGPDRRSLENLKDKLDVLKKTEKPPVMNTRPDSPLFVDEEAQKPEIIESSVSDTSDDYERTHEKEKRQKAKRKAKEAGVRYDSQAPLPSDSTEESDSEETSKRGGTSKKKGRLSKKKAAGLSEKAQGKQPERKQASTARKASSKKGYVSEPYGDQYESDADKIGDDVTSTAKVDDSGAFMLPLQKFVRELVEEADGKEGYTHWKPGRVSAEGRERVRELATLLNSALHVLAKLYGKPPEFFVRYMGYSVSTPRSRGNGWNAFSSKYASDPKTAKQPGGKS